MSRKDSAARFVVTARLLGPDQSTKKRGKEVEYAIEVGLSDESTYTVFRTLKEVATFNAKLLAKFPVEAGYFKKEERVIPDCPVKQTVFGPQRAIRDDRSFEKLLNSYVKELPGLPAALVKSDLVNNFFSLRASDLDVPGETNTKKNGKKKSKGVTMTETSTITGPMALKSYYAVSSYKDKKGLFSFKEGDVVQLMQKDPSGWWMVDASGIKGWAPASYLVPVDDSTIQEETQENKELIGNERAGARYISISSYQASRDDELSFVRGAVVKVLKKYIDGWWLVRYNGGEGFVPGAMFKKFDKRQATVYVKKIQRNFANRRSTKIMPTLKPNWMTTKGRKGDGSLNLVKKRLQDTKNVAVYQCKADFTGDAEKHELTISKGEHVNVLDKRDQGWWFVQDENSRTGWMPATYLQSIVDNDSSTHDDIVGTDRKVIKAHAAQKDDELSINVGEVVEVVRVSNEGWWFVTSLSTFDQGLVPSVCLSTEPVLQNGGTGGAQSQTVPHHRLRSSSKSTSQLESETESKVKTPLVARSTSERGSEISTSLKHDLGSEVSITSSNSDQYYYDDNAIDEQYDEFDEDNDLDSIDMEECYVVTRDYTKLSMDELDVYEGQMVCIIDDSDRDMWYVNADGKEGWLPSNILRAMLGEELTMTSGESTPAEVKLNSTGASADASDMSDSDDHNSQSQKLASSRNDQRPFKRSKVIRKTSAQEPPSPHRPRLDQDNLTPHNPRKKSRSETSSDGEAQSSAGSSITIMVGDKTIEELEREAAEAERLANEAKLRAQQLRDQVKDAKRRSASSGY